ncbi:hypothetical protein [Limnospira platensis]|nr:hypothetical protein APLC1_2314 [Arthrospira platensis C1]
MLNEVVSAAHQATGHTVPREEMMVKKSLADMVKQEAEKAGSPPQNLLILIIKLIQAHPQGTIPPLAVQPPPKPN